jgi:type II secretory pathway pseudopilin PulG
MVEIKVKDRKRGFTILELFIITIIVAILAFLGWRSYKFSRDVERETRVRLNMRVAQIAAKSYYDDLGSFPPSNDDPAYLSYFPGGSCDQKEARAGNFPINPFTNRPEAPRRGHVTEVEQTRGQAPKQIGEPGQIFYSPIAADGSDQITSFAVEGADRDGKSLVGPKPNTTLVLSDR